MRRLPLAPPGRADKQRPPAAAPGAAEFRSGVEIPGRRPRGRAAASQRTSWAECAATLCQFNPLDQRRVKSKRLGGRNPDSGGVGMSQVEDEIRFLGNQHARNRDTPSQEDQPGMFSFEIVKVSFGTFVNRCCASRRPALRPSFDWEPATNDNTVCIRQVLFALTWKG